MPIDLHTHSNASDGALPPSELIQRAIDQGVEVLSITDHDCTTVYQQLNNEHLTDIKLIEGIEFSALWRNITIHILGLNIDSKNQGMLDGVKRQQTSRRKRAAIIAERLEKKGFKNLITEIEKLRDDISVGRPHLAEILVANGDVKTTDEAFRKYLGSGKIGDVKNEWASLSTIIDWIRGAGGTAVIAHPEKYSMTRTRLLELVQDFKHLGGQGMEVVSGRQDDGSSRKLAKICEEHQLLASCGSDFHKPGQYWAELGKHKPLPDFCTPVWDTW